VLLCGPRASPDELPRVDGGVGNREGPRGSGVQAWLSAQRLRRPNLLDRNARRSTACNELVTEGRIVPRRADEQAAGVLDAVGGGSSQDDVLRDALLGRVRVFDRVAAAGVEQAAGGVC